MGAVEWERYPRVADSPLPRSWLQLQADRGLSANTIHAYGRALEDYLRFCESGEIEVVTATREHVARYIRDLNERVPKRDSGSRGLSNATQRQRLVAVRLFYDYLVEDEHRTTNPVGRGHYAPGNPTGGKRSPIPVFQELPWIPTDDEWLRLIEVVCTESSRNRLMFALAYDAALRREELCLLSTSDIDPARHLVTIRAENTKNRRARVVPYSEATGLLYSEYLIRRRQLSRARGAVFLSESPRNTGQPLSIWTWSKIIEGVAQRAGIDQFTTHTLRHLRLTDLARANWDIHEIALFAGHRSTQSTLRYIHLSGRDLARRLQEGMAEIHAWRSRTLMEMLK